LKTISLRGKKIILLPTIKGLTEERKTVREAFHKKNPDAIAVHISREELEGLISVVEGDTEEVSLSHYEEIYARHLAKYGKVQVPPPSLLEAVELGIENNIPIEPLDMNDDAYTDAFCEDISALQLIRHSLRLNRMRKKRFKATTAQEFVIEWDKNITKLKGFRRLEGKREVHMAARLRALTKKYNNILAVLEFERAEGILQRLRDHKETPKK
jgi:pheromone shutdown protein TraB